MKQLPNKIIRLFFIVCILSGCASVPETHPINEYKERNQTIKLISSVTDTPLRFRYIPNYSTSATTAILGPIPGVILSGIVDSVSNKNKQQYSHSLADDVKKISDGIDFNNLLLKEFSRQVNFVAWMTEIPLNNIKKTIKKESQSNRADLLLTMASGYTFSPNYRELNIRVAVNLYDVVKSNATKSYVVVYKNILNYQSPKMPEPVKTQKIIDDKINSINKEYEKSLNSAYGLKKDKIVENINARIKLAKKPYTLREKRAVWRRMWLQNNGVLIKEKVREGMQRIGSLFAYDINKPFDESKSGRGNFKLVKIDNVGKAYRILGRYLTYLPGELVSVDSKEILRKRQGI